MRLSDLEFSYPEELVALQPSPTPRVMWVEEEPEELAVGDLLDRFWPGDVLVINDSKVMRRRVFTEGGLEVLFLHRLSGRRWQVLMPLSRLKKASEFTLPGEVKAQVVERGRPQIIETEIPLTENYFDEHGELPLPPYIQKARGERRPQAEDNQWYQTAWAAKAGSLAAPTASLHFTAENLETLRERGVIVLKVTLHVGLGTFLEIASENLDEHKMHHEEIEVSAEVWQQVMLATAEKRRVWALGTTVTRTLESVAAGLIPRQPGGGYRGSTDLFLRPGSRFQVVNVLLTNFHQPRSTLLALVGAFAGLEKVKAAYAWAIERKFRLFSYGDLTVWNTCPKT